MLLLRTLPGMLNSAIDQGIVLQNNPSHASSYNTERKSTQLGQHLNFLKIMVCFLRLLKTKSFKQCFLIIFFWGSSISWNERKGLCAARKSWSVRGSQCERRGPSWAHTSLCSSSLIPDPYYNQAAVQTKCGLWDFLERHRGQPSLLTHVCGSQNYTSYHYHLEPNCQGEGNYRNLFHFSQIGVVSWSWHAASLALRLGLTQ